MAGRPIVILDTSVFIQDALSPERKGTASQLLAIVSTVAHVVMCMEARAELLEKLSGFGWSAEDMEARYSPIFDAAIWVEPVEEGPHHLKSVSSDSDDTMFVRAAEAVYVAAPEIIEEQERFVVSANTKHFRPGADYASFRFATPHAVLKALG
jgi:hypothetical protein